LKEKKGIYDAKVRELLLLSKQGTPPIPTHCPPSSLVQNSLVFLEEGTLLEVRQCQMLE
jgi:hypothetical protein